MRVIQFVLTNKKFLFISIALLSLFTFVFAILANELSEQELDQFDLPIISWVQSFIHPQLTSLMKLFTWIGSGGAIVLILVLSIFIMVRNKKRWEALFLFIAISGGTVFNQLLKWIYKRERPEIHRLIEETNYSFPSGHSMASFIFYGMLGYFLFLFVQTKWGKIGIITMTSILILIIGLSRVYLGVHYPSDVLAGFAAGGAWLTICLIGLHIIVERRKKTNKMRG